MRNIKGVLAALSATTIIAGCLDGPAPPNNPTINGLAATGGALADAAVSAKCAAGDPLSGKTGSDGRFSLELTGPQAVPCMVQVSNGTVTLHSFAVDAGNLNVTPLSDLVITKALGSDAARQSERECRGIFGLQRES